VLPSELNKIERNASNGIYFRYCVTFNFGGPHTSRRPQVVYHCYIQWRWSRSHLIRNAVVTLILLLTGHYKVQKLGSL